MDEYFLISEMLVVNFVDPYREPKEVLVVDNAFVIDIKPLVGIATFEVYLPDARPFFTIDERSAMSVNISYRNDLGELVDIIRIDNISVTPDQVLIPDLISLSEPEKLATVLIELNGSMEILWDNLEKFKELSNEYVRPDLDVIESEPYNQR